jgi:hypothetical protein
MKGIVRPPGFSRFVVVFLPPFYRIPFWMTCAARIKPAQTTMSKTPVTNSLFFNKENLPQWVVVTISMKMVSSLLTKA